MMPDEFPALGRGSTSSKAHWPSWPVTDQELLDRAIPEPDQKAYGQNNAILDNCHRPGELCHPMRNARPSVCPMLLGTATEMKAMRNYAGQPGWRHGWVTSWSRARDRAPQLLTPRRDQCSCRPTMKSSWSQDRRRSARRKARYFEDRRFVKSRGWWPPEPEARHAR